MPFSTLFIYVSHTIIKFNMYNVNLQLLVFDDLEVPTHKTKNIVSYVNQMEETKKVLLVDGGPIDDKLKLATQNLHYVNVLPSIVSSQSQLFIFHACIWMNWMWFLALRVLFTLISWEISQNYNDK